MLFYQRDKDASQHNFCSPNGFLQKYSREKTKLQPISIFNSTISIRTLFNFTRFGFFLTSFQNTTHC